MTNLFLICYFLPLLVRWVWIPFLFQSRQCRLHCWGHQATPLKIAKVEVSPVFVAAAAVVEAAVAVVVQKYRASEIQPRVVSARYSRCSRKCWKNYFSFLDFAPRTNFLIPTDSSVPSKLEFHCVTVFAANSSPTTVHCYLIQHTLNFLHPLAFHNYTVGDNLKSLQLTYRKLIFFFN